MARISKRAKKEALAVVEQVLSEENTDELVKILRKEIKKRLPRWARWLPIGKVLDALLPGALVKFLRAILS